MSNILFFDFDGVIKESLDVKTNAFVKLFEEHGEAVASRVKNHHLDNGGMSRFEKIPLYLSWAGIESTESLVDTYCNRFSELAFQGVIDCAWVPGALAYLQNQQKHHIQIVVSATPQAELEMILEKLDCRQYFTEVFGAPTRKKDAIGNSMEKYKVAAENCIMFGDARADLEAAQANHVPFILRKHTTNGNLFSAYTGKQINDFTEL